MDAQAVAFTAPGRAELIPMDVPDALGPQEVRGRTLYTLISPGTELAFAYHGLRYHGEANYPVFPGYAAVFEVEAAGDEVDVLASGDLVFAMGKHQSVQRHPVEQVVPVPEELAPEQAPLARLMGVTMTTLITTAARPGDGVIVSGAGPVGYLAAQVFRAAGYRVIVVEPHDGRREAAARSGIEAAYAQIPVNDPAVQDTVALVVECSGHEQAVLDACRVVRPKGEVVLVGVPWERKTDITAHEVLSEVFHRYVVLRSGWEWELPRQSVPFQPHTIFGNFATALRWLAEGRIDVEGLVRKVSPSDAQAAYESLLDRTAPEMYTLFDWQEVGA